MKRKMVKRKMVKQLLAVGLAGIMISTTSIYAANQEGELAAVEEKRQRLESEMTGQENPEQEKIKEDENGE